MKYLRGKKLSGLEYNRELYIRVYLVAFLRSSLCLDLKLLWSSYLKDHHQVFTAAAYSISVVSSLSEPWREPPAVAARSMTLIRLHGLPGISIAGERELNQEGNGPEEMLRCRRKCVSLRYSLQGCKIRNPCKSRFYWRSASWWPDSFHCLSNERG